RTVSCTRGFATSAPARRDLVQDFYIKELKAYKAPVVAKDAHVGVVKSFSTPAAPKPPTLPADLAAELAAYDVADPVRAPAEGAKAEGVLGAGAEEFLQFLEADVVEEHHGHH
ncbi:ATP synthase complex subunit H-domain-containing protein, partial [Vararia minispora EC-137]